MNTGSDELRTSAISPLLLRLYRTKRRRVLALASRLEGGQFRSATLRLILARFHDTEIGAHSYAPASSPASFRAGRGSGAMSRWRAASCDGSTIRSIA